MFDRNAAVCRTLSIFSFVFFTYWDVQKPEILFLALLLINNKAKNNISGFCTFQYEENTKLIRLKK